MPAVHDVATLSAAVTAFRPDELRLTVSPDAAEAVRASLGSSGVVLLGEIHGVRENPQISFAVMREFGIGGLALEWPVSATASVAAWRDGGPLPQDDALWCGDGRMTAGHYALLRARPGGARPAVLLFDVAALPAGATWSDRDAAMGTAVLGAPAVAGGWLVVAGNAHTVTEPTHLGVPMGHHVARARPGVRPIGITYRAGAYYNLAPQRLGPPGDGEPGTATLHVAGERLVLELAEAHEADVPHRPGPVP